MELLIVVVVIAVLAAITIIAYSGINNRAKASAAAAAAEQAAKKVLIYMTTSADQVPPDLATAGVTADSTTYQYSANSSVTPQTFCLTATANNVSYWVNNTTQTSPSAGGCPGHGVNGASPITNLAMNPSFELASPLNAVTANAGANGVTVSSSTDWAGAGSDSLKIVSTSTGNDTAAVVAGSTSTLAGNGVTFIPGHTYTVRATFYLPTPQTGAMYTPARGIYATDNVKGGGYTTAPR